MGNNSSRRSKDIKTWRAITGDSHSAAIHALNAVGPLARLLKSLTEIIADGEAFAAHYRLRDDEARAHHALALAGRVGDQAERVMTAARAHGGDRTVRIWDGHRAYAALTGGLTACLPGCPPRRTAMGRTDPPARQRMVALALIGRGDGRGIPGCACRPGTAACRDRRRARRARPPALIAGCPGGPATTQHRHRGIGGTHGLGDPRADRAQVLAPGRPRQRPVLAGRLLDVAGPRPARPSRRGTGHSLGSPSRRHPPLRRLFRQGRTHDLLEADRPHRGRAPRRPDRPGHVLPPYM